MKARNILYILIALLSTLQILPSCSVQARIKKADKKYAIGEYYDAAEMYRSAYRKVKSKDKKTRAYVAFQQGECYRAINHVQAANAYKNAIRNKYQDSIVYLHYAQVLHYQGKYKEAQQNYQIYLEAHPDSYVAQGGNFACQQIDAWKKQASRYKISPAKEFNEKRTSNFAPAFIGNDADAVMFTSNRTANKKNKQNSSITGTPMNTLYSTRKNAAGKWEEITKAEGLTAEGGEGEEASAEEEEGMSMQAGGDAAPDYGVCCFTADGKTMYFTYSKPVKDSDQGAKIYVSNRASGTWGEPQEVKLFADSTISCGHPSLSANGDTLYFCSDAPDGFGGKDLYFAESTGDGWGNVTNLGKTINTAGDEMYPTIRANGTLYFASNGHPGYGGLDIFKAEPQDTTWVLYNMGAPFNSANDDFGITFAGESENGFFSSNRPSGQRGRASFDQIYSFVLPELVFLVEGNVLDNNGEHLSDATLRLVGTDGTNAKVQVRRDGTYKLKLNKDVQYVMLATARGYLNQKQELNTLELKDSKTYTQDFTLAPISKPVTMDNIFYEFGKWDLTPASETGLNTLIKLLQDNPNITIELSAHTDRVGNAASNKTLSEKRAKSVVDYLIAHGIEKERLTPVGYGKERPVVADKALHDKYKFIPVEQVLDEEFIDSLTPDQQEICNQINRRTEFRVLKTTYKLY